MVVVLSGGCIGLWLCLVVVVLGGGFIGWWLFWCGSGWWLYWVVVVLGGSWWWLYWGVVVVGGCSNGKVAM